MQNDLSPSSIISLQNVNVQYDSRFVLRDVSLSVKPGQSIGILGLTGSGKTTILRAIAGLQPPTTGAILNSAQLGYVFQNTNLIPWLSVYKNLQLCLQDSSDIEEWIALFHLSEHCHKMPHQLSGGMKQKCNLLRALLLKPQLVLMDEPFSSVDVGERADLYRFFHDIKTKLGLTTILVTHDIDEALTICDDIYFLSRRRHSLKFALQNKVMCRGDVRSVRKDAVYTSSYLELQGLYDHDLRGES